jgi:Ca-activated chloride channel family protein
MESFGIDELRYQKPEIAPVAAGSNELMTIKHRYKKPDEDTSKLIVHPLVDTNTLLSKHLIISGGQLL